MDEAVMALIATVIAWLELAAAGLLVLAFVVATANWAKESLVDRSLDARRHYRRALGRGILIGLEVLVAATILKTITLQPTLESMGFLVVMVIIRTAIGWTTSLEINGRWPWQQR